MQNPALSTLLGLTLVCGTAAAKDLNVLMIGNSFAVCVGRYLPAIVNAAPEHTLKLTSAYIGGCPLDRHWANIEESEKNPDAKQYRIDAWTSAAPADKITTTGNINTLIKLGGWDVITIQQASPKSWSYDTFQPYADNLISYIKKYAPGAQIIIQQTWSYNAADNRIKPGTDNTWGFDQAGMFDRVRDAYRHLARACQLPVIPTGLAVQYARASGLGNDVVGAGDDTIHLNRRGEYLQACVWFAALFGADANTITFKPDDMTDDDAKNLRACAQKAVKDYEQAVK